MSSKTLAVLSGVCVIAIVLSGFNSYLVLSNIRIREGRVSELQKDVDEAKDRIATVESALSNLTCKIEALNQSGFANLTEFLTAISNLEETILILNQTPANVYEAAHKSVVVIRTPLGQGSGFFFSSLNHIVTNWHVVESATEIEVEFHDRTREKAILVGSDAYSDVAVIRVDRAPVDAKPLPVSDSSGLWIGRQVVAIGNPLGLTGSLSTGYISQINRLLDIAPIIVPVLQLDITIAPGSSGGPLLDLSGNVVGITNAGTGYGFNFAVPANIAKRVASSLIEKGSYNHPLIGFSAVELNPETIGSMNILDVEAFQTGLLIMEVVPDSPAEEAGLRPAVRTVADGSPAYTPKDIILAVDDHPTLAFEDWVAYVEEHVSPDQLITLTLWRSGEIASIDVTTTHRPPYQE